MRRRTMSRKGAARIGRHLVSVGLSPRLRILLGGTAAIFELSIEEYILRTRERLADAIDAQAPKVTLTARDFRRLIEICQDDSPPGPALKMAAREFKKRYPGWSGKRKS